MLDNKIIKLYDRSRATSDWSCPRKRYWNYEYGGRGIVSASINQAFYMGSAIHDGLAAIAQFTSRDEDVPIDAIAEAAQQQIYAALAGAEDNDSDTIQYANEQAALGEGLIRGFYKSIWLDLLKDQKIFLVEEEMTFKHNGFGLGDPNGNYIFMAKPDLVVENTDGTLTYIEYKSTSSKKDSWILSWNTAVQLHSTMRAIEQTTGRKVSSVIVQGLYKGYEAYGRQSSVMCYGYRRNGTPPFSKDETSYEYKAGFKRIPVWEMSGGSKVWVENMPLDVLGEQFPQTPPIFPSEMMVTEFFKQRAFRESEISMAMELMSEDGTDDSGMLSGAFPQRFDQCTPAYGYSCDYRHLCFGYNSDPLKNGFQWRESHHKPEQELHDKIDG